MRVAIEKLRLQPPAAVLPKTRRAFWRMLLILLGVASISIVAAAQAEAAELTDAAGATGSVDRRAGAPLGAARADRAIRMMREGGGVRPPAGFERFCANDRVYCRPPETRRAGAVAPVDKALIEQLEAFNRSINASYKPADDQELYGVADHWTFPSVYADCEDYVLAKQAALIKAGWPRESVLIGVVVGEISPFHAVLILRTSHGELVLDNMRDEVLDWRDTGYTWVIRQSTERPERWVRLQAEDADAPIELGASATGAL